MATTILNRLNSLQDNPTFQKTPVSKTFYTTKLLNWVEPIEIGGKLKTVFYSELNNNFNIGDRVYILNGNYDSDEFIKINKYSKFSDGYRVLGRDGTRIILDLDYTGTLPYNQFSKDDFIRVHHIRSQREFDYINSLKIALNPLSIVNDSGTTLPLNNFTSIYPKFSGDKRLLGTSTTDFTAVLFTNTIIYASSSFLGSTNTFNLNNGLFDPGFYIKISTTWTKIDDEFFLGKIKNANGNYPQNKKIFIVGEDFENRGIYFRQRNAYEFKNGTWNIDIKSKQPYISKLNFRHGKFTGKHNDGIYGTSLTRNKWNNSEWFSGAIVNSEWFSGSLNSKSTTGERTVYSVQSSTNSRPTETIDFTNNKGFGYNFIEDTNFISANIINGNFLNCNIGYASTFSATENYFDSNTEFNTKISGKFELCNIDSTTSNSSTLVNCIVNNSNLNETNIVNSQLIKTTSDKCTISDKSSIKILAADLWSRAVSNNTTVGILKLYISDIDLDKLEFGNSFYIYRTNKEYFLNFLNDDKKILLPFETKYILDLYFDSENLVNMSVSLKTRGDNELKTLAIISTNNTFSDNISRSGYNLASIDIESSKFSFWIDNTGREIRDVNYLLTPVTRRNVNTFFKDVEISNSDFKSGYFNNSTWQNSANIDYFHHRIKKDGTNVDISTSTNTIIKVIIELNPYNVNIPLKGEDLFVGDLVWLNSITQTLPNGQKKSAAGRYKVRQINTLFNEKEIHLEAQEGQNFGSVGHFRVDDAEFINYISISKFRINNSTINKGFFKRTSIANSQFINVDFNNQDRDLTQANIKQLKFINIIFKDTNNTINAGIFYKSHFINDNWNNGIAFNTIWNKGVFKGGLFNNSYWQDGTFNGGNFINSRELTQTLQDYNTEPVFRNWLNGIFNRGEFSNSYWMKGTFNNGKFYNSEWFSGVWNNGILGSNNLTYNLTKMGVSASIPILSTQSTIWNDGIVENALIGGQGIVNWYGGKFLNGEMTDDSSTSSRVIWHNGDFLGGKITGFVKWRNGNFYKGKFLSIVGWDQHTRFQSNTSLEHWGWENGKFYGGEFGNGSTGQNSVWLNGDFKGGIFMGRYWNNGVFSKGEFWGSLSSSIYSSPESPIYEQQEVNKFNLTNSTYYGFWKNGIVSDNPNKFTEMQTLGIDVKRKSDIRREDNSVLFRNMLWGSGTFSHKNAVMQSSIWLNGSFYEGTFDSGIFNPFVTKTPTTDTRFATFSTSCVWHNGKFDSTIGTGSFFYSEWKKGIFEKGYMSGAIWRDGIWNYGTAENIYWENGRWRNGNWNGSPYNYSDLNDSSTPPFTVRNGRSKQILLHISQVINSDKLYLNNTFNVQYGPEVLNDINVPLVNTSTSSFTSLDQETYNPVTTTTTTHFKSEWIRGTTFSDGTTIITDPHIYTSGGTPDNFRINRVPGYNFTDPLYNIPESNPLYAANKISAYPNNKDVFTMQNYTYEIRITLSVELAPTITVSFQAGTNNPIEIEFNSTTQYISSTGVTNYWAKQYDVTLIHRTPNAILTPPEKQFVIRKKSTGLLRILKTSIKTRDSYPNHIYMNTYNWIGISGQEIVLPSTQITPIGSSENGSIISIYFGNGLFKSGIWENGVWNNGIRSNRMINEPDYYKFSNIIGFDGIRPFGGKNSYQVDDNSWSVTLKALDSVSGLNINDKISIGNICLIDINERRKLIKDYFIITNVDFTNNTITVGLKTDFPIRRIVKDSNNHLIYVSKNIWLSGAFLNGYFRGIWNDGLFKGNPNLTVMEESQWISGKFDGGRFMSKTVNDVSINQIYNDGLIQRFIFLDNYVNPLGITSFTFYRSFIDVTFKTHSYTQINYDSSILENNTYINTYAPINLTPYDGNTNINYIKNQLFKQGLITVDVLESISSLSGRSYRLGYKLNKYENFIPDDGNFIEPFSNYLGNAIDMENFFQKGWTYSEISQGMTDSFSTQSSSTAPYHETRVLVNSPIRFEANTNTTNPNILEIDTTTIPEKNLVIQNYNASHLNHIRVNGLKLTNTNFDFIKNRYYMIQLDLRDVIEVTPVYPQFAYTVSNNNVTNPNRDPSLQSQTSSLHLEIIPDINELDYSNPIKTHYFYNKRELDIFIKSISEAIYDLQWSHRIVTWKQLSVDNAFKLSFNNISLWETDMIPFFKYYRNKPFFSGWVDDIDVNSLITPQFAIAPFIDYTNSNFDFINNVRLTIDRDEVLGQNTSAFLNNTGL